MAALAGCDLVIIGNGGDNADPNGDDVQSPCVRTLLEAARTGELPMARVDESVRRILAFKLLLGDMNPAADVTMRDWSPHAAFAQAIAAASVKVQRDADGLLPLPEGALFMSRVSQARLGVEEGDHLVDGFVPMAARLTGGEAIEFDHLPDVEALWHRIAAAPAVVLAITGKAERDALMDTMRSICAIQPRCCIVCLDVPRTARPLSFASCLITAYDQTADAIRAVCKVLKGERA